MEKKPGVKKSYLDPFPPYMMSEVEIFQKISICQNMAKGQPKKTVIFSDIVTKGGVGSG